MFLPCQLQIATRQQIYLNLALKTEAYYTQIARCLVRSDTYGSLTYINVTAVRSLPVTSE
jgi:hypothetical protein